MRLTFDAEPSAAAAQATRVRHLGALNRESRHARLRCRLSSEDLGREMVRVLIRVRRHLPRHLPPGVDAGLGPGDSSRPAWRPYGPRHLGSQLGERDPPSFGMPALCNVRKLTVLTPGR
ncbi:MAG TPA: hypothetical protein VGR26_00545 [Acidimicrobiales bacterium]|nr:hypothetical protein [Acidimicrobiales bacterium]